MCSKVSPAALLAAATALEAAQLGGCADDPEHSSRAAALLSYLDHLAQQGTSLLPCLPYTACCVGSFDEFFSRNTKERPTGTYAMAVQCTFL